MRNETFEITRADMILMCALKHIRNEHPSETYSLALPLFTNLLSAQAFGLYLDSCYFDF